ncbi:acyltransferase [Pseudodesulfovibrio senegalensis]|uniref:Acyltransferase n=1 Tax=Pseudodesulfovibrio senegalensis TaxID=1721087 RepID=A0A6N6N1L3_9BACT|nr:acyltransferase [Pseudodesulfovibrio senegalensis]KAB1441288.1 acyltransferase [Pseudodesulfovibrio senegalensis]
MRVGRFLERVIKMPWVALWGLPFFVFNAGELRHWMPMLGGAHEWLRTFFLRRLGARIGKGSRVRSHAYVTRPKFLRMGVNSRIGNGCRLFLHDRLTIGDNVHIGSGLSVITTDHRIDDPARPLAAQGMNLGPVTIEDDVYIGANVTILRGVTIHGRTVVAAGAVVTSELASGFVYGGVPAKPLRALDS